MGLEIPQDGFALESSASTMAGLPSQAFGISLSDSDIEKMIACVQNGDNIELSLGDFPAFLFGDQKILVPDISDCAGYDLFQSDSSEPSEILNKLPNPTMGLFTPLEAPKPKARATKKAKAPPKSKESAKTSATRAPVQTRKAASSESPKLSAVPDQDAGDDEAAAIANLKNSLARVEADKNTAVVVPGLLGSKGKVRPSNRLLDNASPRSLPPSPALSGIGSPSLGSGAEQSRSQTFPIIHELALSELTFRELLEKWNEGSEDEFRIALNKVADFDEELQKWTLKKKQWKELDVFEYEYATEEDRQTAIEHAIKQYDRQRIGPSDPIWQKLLPVGERGKGVCLSKLQAAFARGPTVPKPKGDSTSGSDKDESGSSSGLKAKGGEAMSRSSSQTSATGKKKLSASEAQAKRLLSNAKKPAAATQKASPKVSPTKPLTKVPPAKGGRVLSKEFVSDSSSDDEVPLSTSLAKSKVAAAAAPSRATRETAVSRAKARPLPSTKPSAKDADRERESGRESVRAEVVARPAKPGAKRQRATEDDDSSSSGTPLSKRVKAGTKAPTTAANSSKASSAKPRTTSDASQNGRGSVSAALASKPKNNSPMKSSPLAASPPTNASEIEQDRASRTAAATERERQREREREKEERERERQREDREREKERVREERERERERQRDLREEREREKERQQRDRDRERERAQRHQREREREHSQDTISSTSSGAESTVGKKRPAPDSYSEQASKKQRVPSKATISKALKFRQFYERYIHLHNEMVELEDPDPTKVNDLFEMRDRLQKMKDEIYAETVE
ncbi:hypothetical protein QBC35DRAFT_543398 [Podospora australis]|uniref:E3 ubiquitin-protein ligase UBR1-like winged-helix domain-containing protein n=1 Tax=Podospora australis TaxID=1536484 RepID=A0AAN7ALS8_9PEZI|nr:hypothetical protein QBC35DRAFT_543398 [Podospora australis]